MLVADKVEIVNPPLCDIAVVTSTFLLTFMSPAQIHYKLFGALLVFAGLTYSINRVRILRWQSVATYSTTTLNKAESYLWALPLAVLAGAFGCQLRPDFFGRATFGFAAGLNHLVVHCVFVRFILPAFQVERPPDV